MKSTYHGHIIYDYQGHIISEDNSDEILDEHKNIASQIDLVCEMVGKKTVDFKETIASIDKLLKITEAHFRHEEKIMAMSEFPGRFLHKMDHDYMLKGLSDFIASAVDQTVKLTPQFCNSLKGWMTLHSKKFDDTFTEFQTLGGVSETLSGSFHAHNGKQS